MQLAHWAKYRQEGKAPGGEGLQEVNRAERRGAGRAAEVQWGWWSSGVLEPWSSSIGALLSKW